MKCFYCDQPATLLCDFVLEHKVTGKNRDFVHRTCDRPICAEHSARKGTMHFCSRPGGCRFETIDYCRGHAQMPR